jgi:hypothetical protein
MTVREAEEREDDFRSFLCYFQKIINTCERFEGDNQVANDAFVTAMASRLRESFLQHRYYCSVLFFGVVLVSCMHYSVVVYSCIT